ncbi:MAG: ABC transporter permease [Bacteroidetes bacterium]|nr:ABC transporter permease [Bacteroidota bacterium]
MIVNYLKTTFRSIFRNKLFSILNILGLALGLSTTILILLWVQDELSFDKHFKDYQQIYRIIGMNDFNGQAVNVTTTVAPLAENLKSEYPDIIKTCRLRPWGSELVRAGDLSFRVNRIVYADSTFFNFFDLPLIYGDPNTVLNQTQYVALSEKTALKFFPDENPIGKTLIINETSYMVSGVYEDIPFNTHFHFNIIISMNSLNSSLQENWVSDNFRSYLLLHPDSDIEWLEEKINELFLKHFAPAVESRFGIPFEKAMEGRSSSLHLQALTDIHLKSDLIGELESNSDITYVYIFSFVALFILVVACINFVNMTTARLDSRSKEVGVRKVSGAHKKQIIFQFMLESFILVIISYFVAMIVVELVLPAFNTLSQKEISIGYFNIPTLLKIIAIIIITGISAGSYPSFYLSSFKPVIVLKGGTYSGKGRGRLRNVLVVIQFITTIVLISCCIFINQQLKLIQTKPMGYSRESIIRLSNTDELKERAQEYKNKLYTYPQIKSGTLSTSLPTPSGDYNTWLQIDSDPNQGSRVTIFFVDYDYIKTFKMEIIEGRAFSRDFSTDEDAIIVNEAFLRKTGMTEPLTHYLSQVNDDARMNIIGVIKDFHFKSLKNEVTPIAMVISNTGNYLSIRYESENVNEVITILESNWENFFPNLPFEYTFIDDEFNNMYTQENRMGIIMNIFMFLVIVIALLGLFGLATFTAEKRTKEIGIRKVNGASLFNIFMLFTKDIAILILIAFVLAVPLSWYIMDKWLNNFTYRVEINWMVFIGAGLISFIIAILTISYQAYQASTRNPIESLKYE